MRTPLDELVGCWKSLSTRYTNERLGRTGRWWQLDFFDRYEEHYRKAVHYIENNPVAAGLVKNAKDWLWSSAKWRPEGYGLQSLKIPQK